MFPVGLLYSGNLSCNTRTFLKKNTHLSLEIDFSPLEKLVYIIHLFFCFFLGFFGFFFGRLQREEDMNFQRHQRSRVGYCHAPVLLLPSTASPFSLALLFHDKYYHLCFACVCTEYRESIYCSITGFFFSNLHQGIYIFGAGPSFSISNAHDTR